MAGISSRLTSGEAQSGGFAASSDPCSSRFPWKRPAKAVGKKALSGIIRKKAKSGKKPPPMVLRDYSSRGYSARSAVYPLNEADIEPCRRDSASLRPLGASDSRRASAAPKRYSLSRSTLAWKKGEFSHATIHVCRYLRG